MNWEWLNKINKLTGQFIGPKEIKFGIKLTPDELYSMHHVIKDKMEYVLVDISKMAPKDINILFARFGKTYKLIIPTPVNANIADVRAFDFKDTLGYIKNLIKLCNGDMYALLVRMSEYGELPLEEAKSMFENVFLKRVLPIMSRAGMKTFVINDTYEIRNKFPFAYLVDVVRMHKDERNFHSAMDFEKSHYVGNKIMLNLDKLGALKKDFKLITLSGLGVDRAKRVAIPDCKVYRKELYIKLVEQFRHSIIIFDCSDVKDSVKSWDYIIQQGLDRRL